MAHENKWTNYLIVTGVVGIALFSYMCGRRDGQALSEISRGLDKEYARSKQQYERSLQEMAHVISVATNGIEAMLSNSNVSAQVLEGNN